MTLAADIQERFADLQRALGISLACGTITLNVNDGQLASVKTETYAKVEKRLDSRLRRSA